MNYKFKISRRLALLKDALLVAAAVSACAPEHATTAPDTEAAVPPPIPSVASITISPPADSSVVGEVLHFSAVARDSAGTVLSGSFAWVSRDPAVAVVDTAGAVTTLAAGATTIVASSGNRSDSARLLVSPVPVPPPAAARTGWYAAPGGTAGGAGSAASPWDLATALAGGGRVQPGDTIWLRGGTYRGAFRSTVSGAAGQPVVVRQYPGERAIIDGAGTPSSTSVFYVGGAYTVFWGFEITNSDPVRTTASLANNVRPNVVANYASHTRYLNLVVHDGGVAFYTEPEFGDVEIVGCIMYNNGWQGPDRGHGHALYLKSAGGPVVARDNVVFNQFGYGVHVYTNAGTGKLINIRLEGNVAFNNGTLSNNSTSANILVGGADYADADVLTGNMTYFSPGAGGTNVQVGFGTLANGGITLENNKFVGGVPVLNIGYWDRVTMNGNTLVGTGRMVTLNDNATSGYSWGSTRQFGNPLSSSWSFLGLAQPWLTWQLATGLGLSDVVSASTPAGTEVVVRPNGYETGRANIVVYNWAGAGSASADLSGVVPVGARYEIRNVQRLFDAPAVSGTYGGGSVSIPLAAVAAPIPVGLASSPAPALGSAFNTYIVTIAP